MSKIPDKIYIKDKFIRSVYGCWVALEKITSLYVKDFPNKNWCICYELSNDEWILGEKFSSEEEAQYKLDQLMGVNFLDENFIIDYKIPTRLENILKSKRIKTAGQVKQIKRSEFMQWKNAGEKSWYDLKNLVYEIYGDLE